MAQRFDLRPPTDTESFDRPRFAKNAVGRQRALLVGARSWQRRRVEKIVVVVIVVFELLGRFIRHGFERLRVRPGRNAGRQRVAQEL